MEIGWKGKEKGVGITLFAARGQKYVKVRRVLWRNAAWKHGSVEALRPVGRVARDPCPVARGGEAVSLRLPRDYTLFVFLPRNRRPAAMKMVEWVLLVLAPVYREVPQCCLLVV